MQAQIATPNLETKTEYTYGVLRRDPSHSRHLPWEKSFLGRRQERLGEMYCQFIKAINHETEGAKTHFKKSLDVWDAVVIAKEGDAVVGYASLRPGSNTQAMELEVLYVDPNHARRGISKHLIAHSEYIAREDGAKYLEMIIKGEGHHANYMQQRGYGRNPDNPFIIRKEL